MESLCVSTAPVLSPLNTSIITARKYVSIPWRTDVSLRSISRLDFLAVSFQKRLIEQVIDARRSRQSLMDMPSFRTMYAGKRNNVAATVYVRMKEVGMGKDTDGSVRRHAWEAGRSSI